MGRSAVEWCGVMTDRNARHQQEDALREAKTAAEKANIAKGAFLVSAAPVEVTRSTMLVCQRTLWTQT